MAWLIFMLRCVMFSIHKLCPWPYFAFNFLKQLFYSFNNFLRELNNFHEEYHLLLSNETHLMLHHTVSSFGLQKPYKTPLSTLFYVLNKIAKFKFKNETNTFGVQTEIALWKNGDWMLCSTTWEWALSKYCHESIVVIFLFIFPKAEGKSQLETQRNLPSCEDIGYRDRPDDRYSAKQI